MTHVSHSPPALLDVRGLDVRFRGRDGATLSSSWISRWARARRWRWWANRAAANQPPRWPCCLLAPEARIAGEVRFRGQDLVRLPLPQLRAIRGGEISMIFQEPMTSLNPVHTVGAQIVESLRLHQGLSREAAHRRRWRCWRW